MLFYKRSTWWNIERGFGLVPMDAACWMNWGEGIKLNTLQVHPKDLLPCICLPSFTFISFLIYWHLSPAVYPVSWCRSCFVCSRLIYEIYSGCGPSTYVYCVVCYCVKCCIFNCTPLHSWRFLTPNGLQALFTPKNFFLKVEYHANENPLQKIEKNSICWSKVNVSNSGEKNNTLPCYFFF